MLMLQSIINQLILYSKVGAAMCLVSINPHQFKIIELLLIVSIPVISIMHAEYQLSIQVEL